jgi:glutamate 5-kinase
VIIVSSGSIALGRRQLGFAKGPLKLEESQAAAAAGQIKLAHGYQEALARHGITVAQVLLTIGDTEERRRYLNARNTLEMLLRQGAMPVINENDTVATSEIRYGDNDRLAGRVAQMTGADCLVLLSDIDGLYTADPTIDADAQFIPEVGEITPEILAMAGATRSDYGKGGMITKLQAGKIALAAGCHMVIADGHVMNPLSAIEQDARCTWFVPRATPRTARKLWIAGSLKPAGAIIIDDGAARALRQGKSLLPAGVTGVEGEFDRGEAVIVRDAASHELGRGLCAYSAADARRIMGCKSHEIEVLLGIRGRDEMIHRDDLVMS